MLKSFFCDLKARKKIFTMYAYALALAKQIILV